MISNSISLTHQYLRHYKVQQTLKWSEISAKAAQTIMYPIILFIPQLTPFFTVCSKIYAMIQQNLDTILQQRVFQNNSVPASTV